MLKVLEISIGVCSGILLSFLALWIIMCITRFLSGDRYFSPSKHLMKERKMRRRRTKDDAETVAN